MANGLALLADSGTIDKPMAFLVRSKLLDESTG